ncbi:MAG TPA: hypothetical protein VFP19_06380 [Candidatus Limnocylindrales bacterium]|nr:hypothetical protein [Candidatus Limnocylindrales bacterium]
MTNGGTRTVLVLVAAAWFLVGAANLGSGYPLAVGGGPNEISDTTARAIVELGRVILVGLAILSVSLADASWISAMGRRLADNLRPTP